MANIRKLQRNALSFTPRADAPDFVENPNDPFRGRACELSRGPYFDEKAGAGEPGGTGDADGTA
jgi:hypothetical protein